MGSSATTPPPCPSSVTTRRNPPRRARPTPSKTTIPTFPTTDILSMNLHPPDHTNKLNNAYNPNPLSLKVFLRIRPKPTNSTTTNKSSKLKKVNVKPSSKSCITVNDSHSVTVSPPCDSGRAKSEIYNGFSGVFSPDSSQDEVYEKLMRPIVEEFLNGRSGLLAALGPSGSGKTHTVFGSAKDPGLVPRALRHLFESAVNNVSRSFYLSIFEICSEKGKGEKLFDLSSDGSDIYMHQSSVKGLKEVLVTTIAQAESILAHAKSKRATAMTNSNSQSSRSQCIINIRCTNDQNEGQSTTQPNGAILTFVDLAGAEREKKTGNQGERLLQSNFINNTSMVFGLCLRSLLEHQNNPKKPLQKHFQSSLLTRYLRDYLEGRKRMALILTARCGDEDYFDTSYLLRQASPFMEIKFHDMEEALNVPVSKRRYQPNHTEKRKRVKLSTSDSLKDCIGHIVKASDCLPNEDSEIVDASVSCQRDPSPGASNKKSLVSHQSTDAAIKRENQIMRGLAKAMLSALKKYKGRVEALQNEVDILSEKLKIGNDQNSVIEGELQKVKCLCSCNERKSAGNVVPQEKANISHGQWAALEQEAQLPDSTDVSEVNPQDFPTATKNLESTDVETESDVALTNLPISACMASHDSETFPQETNEVQRSVIQCENSHDQVGGSDSHLQVSVKKEGGKKTKKKEGEDSKDLSCVAVKPVLDVNIQFQNSGFVSHVKDDQENVMSGPVSSFNSERETKQTSQGRRSNALKPRRRLMPASSLLLRDVGGMDITPENEKLRRGKAGRTMGEDEGTRTRGSASLLRLLKNHLPR